MKTKNQNKINVSGNVKISTQRGKKKIKQQVIKNNATPHLFAFLVQALNGDLKTNYVPSALQISTRNTANKTITHTATISIQQTEIDEHNITFGFYVKFSQLGSLQGSGNWQIIGLKLQGQTEQSLAEIDLSDNPFTGIDPRQVSYSLLVDWTIGFKNATATVVSQT